jgi:hypothetical protein
MSSFIDFFDPWPIAALFAVFIAAGLAFIFGLEAVVHRNMRSDTHERVSTSTPVMIQVLAVFYSVLIAFVIVGERARSAKPTTTWPRKQGRCRPCSKTSVASQSALGSGCARRSSPTTGRC